MEALEDRFDCPECHSAGSIRGDVCEICDAEFGESFEAPAWERSVAQHPRTPVPPMLHPSVPLRFADVIDELQEIATMASAAVEVEGAKLAGACRRAQSLLRVLRAQFMQDVVESGPRVVTR